jgi:hypothetical protein
MIKLSTQTIASDDASNIVTFTAGTAGRGDIAADGVQGGANFSLGAFGASASL